MLDISEPDALMHRRDGARYPMMRAGVFENMRHEL